MNPSRNGFILAIIACLIALSASVWMATGSGNAQAPTPPAPAEGVDMIAFPDMMVPPVLPENPTQADYGRQVYYYVCMTCHGNLGQGLTQEWIDAWGEESSCWQSKCHAANHPPEGFELPRAIPAVAGPNGLNRFDSALELHDFIQAAMPWQAPSSLSEEEYWQVTAYLLRLNEVDLGGEALNEASAKNVVLGREAEAASPPGTVVLVGAGTGGVLVLALVAWKLVRKKFTGER